jgi:hypothetical protein
VARRRTKMWLRVKISYQQMEPKSTPQFHLRPLSLTRLVFDGYNYQSTDNLTNLWVAFGHAQCDVSRRLHNILDVLLLESSSSSLPPARSAMIWCSWHKEGPVKALLLAGGVELLDCVKRNNTRLPPESYTLAMTSQLCCGVGSSQWTSGIAPCT